MKYLIILFGAPGCGKGHLSNKLITCLEKKLSQQDIQYLSTGDLIRDEIKKESQIGVCIKQFVQSGELVPDYVVDKLIANALTTSNQTLGILDGYPRTEKQLDFLGHLLTGKNVSVLTVFRDTPEDVIKERVSKRRVCAQCKKTHSVEDGCCPHCGGQSVIRKDDAVIDKRLEEYRKNTLPLWNKIDNIGATLRLDGTTEADDAAQQISDILYP